MRISDWSSDVCSSDLVVAAFVLAAIFGKDPPTEPTSPRRKRKGLHLNDDPNPWYMQSQYRFGSGNSAAHNRWHKRSEEHTSALQSLMRNSYAVFCFKKNNKRQNTAMTPRQPNTTYSQTFMETPNTELNTLEHSSIL